MEKEKQNYNYINNYQKEKYDRLIILRKKGDKKMLTNIAKEKGFRTLTEFVNTCIDEKIKRMKIDLIQYQDKTD